MCDQDHFENDRQEFEARGLVTRKQFGVMLGAGIGVDDLVGELDGELDVFGQAVLQLRLELEFLGMRGFGEGTREHKGEFAFVLAVEVFADEQLVDELLFFFRFFGRGRRGERGHSG